MVQKKTVTTTTLNNSDQHMTETINFSTDNNLNFQKEDRVFLYDDQKLFLGEATFKSYAPFTLHNTEFNDKNWVHIYVDAKSVQLEPAKKFVEVYEQNPKKLQPLARIVENKTYIAFNCSIPLKNVSKKRTREVEAAIGPIFKDFHFCFSGSFGELKKKIVQHGGNIHDRGSETTYIISDEKSFNTDSKKMNDIKKKQFNVYKKECFEKMIQNNIRISDYNFQDEDYFYKSIGEKLEKSTKYVNEKLLSVEVSGIVWDLYQIQVILTKMKEQTGSGGWSQLKFVIDTCSHFPCVQPDVFKLIWKKLILSTSWIFKIVEFDQFTTISVDTETIEEEKVEYLKKRKLIHDTHQECQNLVGDILTMDKLYSSDDVMPESKEHLLEHIEVTKQKRKEQKENSKKFKFTAFVDNFGYFLTHSTKAAEKKIEFLDKLILEAEQDQIVRQKATEFLDAGTRVCIKLEMILDLQLKNLEK